MKCLEEELVHQLVHQQPVNKQHRKLEMWSTGKVRKGNGKGNGTIQGETTVYKVGIDLTINMPQTKNLVESRKNVERNVVNGKRNGYDWTIVGK